MNHYYAPNLELPEIIQKILLLNQASFLLITTNR
jgi:hypothetical protein